LTNLDSINMAFNGFTGSIPSELGNLPSLNFLSLAGNNLTGTIPSELGNLTALDLLDLSDNQLTGAIPVELGNMSLLTALQLESNQLTGAFPVELENLTNLMGLNLSNNQLAGPIICNFANMPNLELLMLSDNQFDGSFPTSISSLTSLQNVTIAQNQFTSIPAIGSYDLHVENNNLDFSSLEPNISSPNFSYDPQAKLPPGGNVSFTVGGTLSIPFTTGGTGNFYQWYNSGIPVAGANALALSKQGMVASDAGIYYLQVTSSIVSGLTLESEPYLVYTDLCSAVSPSGGNLDMTFDPLIDVPTSVGAIGIQSTGQIVVSTGSTTIDGTSVSGIVRFNTDGSLDNTFTSNGYYSGSGVLLVQPDDKIITIDGSYIGLDLIRLNEDGSSDAGFNQNINSYAFYALALQPDNNILVSYQSGSSSALSRLLPDGTLDGSFTAPPDLAANVIKVQADGFVLVGGWFSGGITRLDGDGVTDAGFLADADDEVTDIAIQADGKIIVVGLFAYFNNIPHRGIVRLNTDGSIDNSFKAIGISDLVSLGSFPTKIALQNNGQIILSGIFNGINGSGRVNLVRLNTDGTIDCTFDPGAGTDSIISSMQLQPDDQILIAGDFTSYDGTTRNGFARVNNPPISCLPANQRAALVALYNSTNGINWTDNSNWLNADESTWYGVDINACNVININLAGNNLVGSIPTQIGNLSSLSFLELHSNKLSGSIPTELGNISTMAFLRLQNNLLTGTIPASFGNWNNVFLLELNENQLTGSIPTELGQNTLLKYLNLGNNKLSGNIPAQLSSLPVLEELNLGGNLLTGSIPTELGNIFTLKLLTLRNNLLTGAIPASIGNLTNLVQLDLDQNQLTGSIPVELGQATALKYLFIYENQLSGSIPIQLGNLVNLETMDIFTNQLTGNLPKELAGCIKLKHLEVANNLLTGSLPKELSALVDLEIFQINDNGFTGEMPVEYLAWTKIQDIYVTRNQLTGVPTFPPALITHLEVESNLLEFDDLEPKIGTTGFIYNPQADLPGGIISLDAGSTLTIPFSTLGSGNQYQWFKNGVLLAGATLSSFSKTNAVVSDAGNYTVDITSTLVPGLTLHSLPFVVTVIGNNPPVISATSLTVPVQGSATINLLAFLSDPDNDLDLSSLTIVTQPSSGAVASIIGTTLSVDYSGVSFSGTDNLRIRICDLGGSCVEQDLSVEVVGAVTVFNALSPGVDDKNEVFLLQYIDILESTKNNKVVIFNRWGDVVWEVENYNNTTRVFTGLNKNGNELPTGVYFYKVTFSGGEKPLEGFISLKRQ
jgi:uncharacterized delta-60 repeat protein/gliding motility-associated-like protein